MIYNKVRKGVRNMLKLTDLYNEKNDIRIAVYARVSTEHEAQLSALENQKDWYSDELDRHPNWRLVEMYVDKGITGTSATKRPEFMKMIEDAKSKKFDVIITREVSRLARNTIDTLKYTRELKRIGVGVFFISDNIFTLDNDGELRLSIMATLAQDESRKISNRVKYGQQTSMENGVYYGNGNILGYDRVGKDQYVINPEQSRTVRMIFDWYLDGFGIRAIKEKLEKSQRLTATGKSNWYESNISKILKNSFYCGILTYHKQWTPDFLEQKKINNIGDMEYTRAKGKHEPIISVEEYEAVQEKIKQRQKELPETGAGRRRTIGERQPINVWTELLVCECNHRFNRKVWHRTEKGAQYAYQCYSSIRSGSIKSRQNKGLSTEGVCSVPMIPEWKLQMMSKHIFSEYLVDYSKAIVMAEELLAKHIDDIDANSEENEKIIRSLCKEQEKLSKRLDGLFDMRADGEISREEFMSKKGSIEKKLDEIAAEIDALTPEQEDPEEVADHEERMTFLRFALDQLVKPNDKDDIPEDVIRAFVKKIVVHPDSFDWYLRFSPDGNGPQKLGIEGKRRNNAKVSLLSKLQDRLLSATSNNCRILTDPFAASFYGCADQSVRR